jgi:hypothetical protein
MAQPNAQKVTKGKILFASFLGTILSTALNLFIGNTCVIIMNQEKDMKGTYLKLLGKVQEGELEEDKINQFYNDLPSCASLQKCVAILLHLGTVAFITVSLATFIKYSFTQKLLFSIFLSKILIISTGGLAALNILFYVFAITHRATKINIAKHRVDDMLVEGKATDGKAVPEPQKQLNQDISQAQ